MGKPQKHFNPNSSQAHFNPIQPKQPLDMYEGARV